MRTVFGPRRRWRWFNVGSASTIRRSSATEPVRVLGDVEIDPDEGASALDARLADPALRRHRDPRRDDG